jgi:hypothetical protein
MVNAFFPLPIALFALTSAASQEAELLYTPDTPRIYGGEIAKTCQFPSAVYNSEDGCSGTLVHPLVIIHAGHCGKPGSFTFGEDGDSPARKVTTKWCEADAYEATDYAICVLDEPVTDVPIAPILQGCEADILEPGKMITLAGFGYSNNASGGKDFGVKRFVEVPINRITDTEAYLGGMNGKGGCNGDSGGPAFVQLDDGTWRTFGSTHGGDMHPNCAEGSWKLTHVAMSWYEEKLKAHGESEIDLSPCFNDSGDWQPTDACGGYATNIAGPFGSWANGCSEGAPLSGPSATCGPALDDEAPSVEVLAPDGDATYPLGETIVVEVEAKDNLEVVEVDLFVDGKSQGALTKEPYTWELDDLDLGKHELKASASDAAMNSGESATVIVTIDDDEETGTHDESSSESGDESTSSETEGDDDDDDDDDDSSTSDDADSDAEESGDSGDETSDDSESGESESDDDDDEDEADAGGADDSGCGCRSQSRKDSWLAALILGVAACIRRKRGAGRVAQ